MNACPICSNQSSELKYELAFAVYQCTKCRFQFCPEAAFDKSFISGLDEEARDKALKQLRKDNFQKIIQSINKYKTNNYKGLEVGCGYGWFLEVCKENFIECKGIEPETRFNERYKTEGLNVTNGFYPNDLQADTKYDFIVFNDVIEHLPDLKAIMKTNYSLLNPGGLLIINLPVQEGLVYFFSKAAYVFGIKSFLNRMWQFNFHSPHLSYFTKRNLIDFASENNFYAEHYFKLKTINLSEITDRIKQDNTQGILARFAISMGVYFLYPFLQLFPDTFCFIFRKKEG